MILGAQKGYPPWARSPPQIKRRTPQLVNPTQPRTILFHHAFLTCNCFVFLQQLHQTLHCQMFPHPPPRGVFGPSVKFQDAKTKKKNHPPNDWFLIKNLLKNDVFGSSERLPPLSAVPPTNKKTHPPISKPHPATKSFFPTILFSCASALFFCNSYINIALPDVSSSTSQGCVWSIC